VVRVDDVIAGVEVADFRVEIVVRFRGFVRSYFRNERPP